MVETFLGLDRAGVANHCQIRVINQGQNRVSVRGGGNFDDALVLQLFVGGDDFCHQCPDSIEQNDFVFLTEIAAFVYQCFERLLRQVIRVNPGEIEPDLKITEILLGKGLYSSSNRCRISAIA